MVKLGMSTIWETRKMTGLASPNKGRWSPIVERLTELREETLDIEIPIASYIETFLSS